MMYLSVMHRPGTQDTVKAKESTGFSELGVPNTHTSTHKRPHTGYTSSTHKYAPSTHRDTLRTPSPHACACTHILTFPVV